ncbi:MAG: hypothetical protein IJH63_15580, partial [Methanobrevibacter sp.]|nr:hypothetical protein [Methanobrevibacter sp.]
EKEEKKEETVEIPGDAGQLFLVKVETEGIGLVAAAKEGEALEFDEQMTSSSAYMNVPAGTVLKIGAKDSVDDYVSYLNNLVVNFNILIEQFFKCGITPINH